MLFGLLLSVVAFNTGCIRTSLLKLNLCPPMLRFQVIIGREMDMQGDIYLDRHINRGEWEWVDKIINMKGRVVDMST